MDDSREDTAVVQLKVRMREWLRARLEEQAKAHGTSINAEVINRLERSFDRQDLLSEVLQLVYSSRFVGILMMLGRVMEEVGYFPRALQFEGELLEDTDAFDQAILAAITLLNAVRPLPESGKPRLNLSNRSHQIISRLISEVRLPRDDPAFPWRSTTKLRSLLGPIADRLWARLHSKVPNPRTSFVEGIGAAIAQKVLHLINSRDRTPSNVEVARLVAKELSAWV